MNPAPSPSPRHLRRSAPNAMLAREVGEELYYPHHLTVRSGPGELRLQAEAVLVGPFTIGTLDYSHPIRVDTGPYENAYQVNVALGSPISTSAGSESLSLSPRQAAVYGPDVPTAFSGWERPGRMLAVKLERHGFERLVRTHLGLDVAEPLRLRLGLRVDAGPGATWLADLRRLRWAARRCVGTPLLNRLMQAAAVDLVVAADPDLAELARTRTAAAPGAVARAIELMEAAPGADIDLAGLAEYTGVSGRALQLAFRRDLDTTPLRHLRELRLEQAHRALLAGQEGSSVAQIARAAGFGHLGRFASAYRDRYGHLPSRDLGRDAG